MFALLDSSVEWKLRERRIRSIYVLYRDLFAPRCSDHLGHLSSGSEAANPLNAICYMWWDVCPLPHNVHYPEKERVDPVILDVLKRTLQLESNACREGALHGLGHFGFYYPDPVHAIIDDFLGSGARIPESLREYARTARTGMIL
jgi:hypothetical protein